MRVPMIVVSPWTRGGAVASTVCDHTSVIQFLEKRFGVREPNISPWRREITGDLTDVFDFSGKNPSWPTLPDTSGNRQKVTDTGKLPAPTVPEPQLLPAQQRGSRTARPTPYDLRVTPACAAARSPWTSPTTAARAPSSRCTPSPASRPSTTH
ncbi:alkaline phosphatase family protein [Streptomyces aureus]